MNLHRVFTVFGGAPAKATGKGLEVDIRLLRRRVHPGKYRRGIGAICRPH